MSTAITRRRLLAGTLGSIPALCASRPAGTLVDSHVHLFSTDTARFPFSPKAPYQPKPSPVEDYLKVVAGARLDHSILVHPEPYQDDHRYLEYCFAHEPSPGYFRGTCLFDPIAPDTPARMQALTRQNPDRIVALRIHEMRQPGAPPASAGAIKDRDMHSPAMQNTWRKAQELGLAIQMHCLPHFASEIGELARKFPNVRVLLDHLGRGGQERPADFEQVLRLAKLPKIYIKYSGVEYSSKQPYPHLDARPLVRRAFDAFGPDRMIWGGLGNTLEEFDRQVHLFNVMFDFAAEGDRAKIRGLNAMKVYFGP